MNKPALYSTINHLQRRDTNDFTEEYEEEIGQMSGRCLDVGSGPGDVAVDVILSKLNKNASLVCSDISEEMLKFAEEKYKNNRRVSFIKLDIETPDLPKDLVGQFDHVISCWCLHWCQDMRQTFENIFNLLRPGGSSFLMFLANCPGMNSYKKLEAMSRYQPYMKNAERYTPLFQHSLEPRKTLKALIEDVGFEVHHCSVREKNYTFDSPNTLREFLLPINPFLDRIPANLAEEYKKDLVNEFAGLSIIFNKNNKNENDYSVLSIKAKELRDNMYKPALYVKANDKQRRDASDISEELNDVLGEISGRCIDVGSGTCDVVADFILPKLNTKANIVSIKAKELRDNMYKPALYVKANDKQRRDASDISEEFNDVLGEISGRCIDVGSGTCDVVADFILPKLNPQANIVCSDISDEMLDFARERYKDNDRMSFVKLNIESQNLPEYLIEQFDHVTSFYCLHWCKDMRQVFKNILRLLKPGGTTLLAFQANTPVRNAYPVLAAMPRYQPYMQDVDRYIPVYYNSEKPCEAMKALMKDAGFDILHLSCRERSYIFKNPAFLSDFLLAVNPFIDRMPADLREEYRRDLMKEIEKPKIIFDKNINNNEKYRILFGYHIFVARLEKSIKKIY